ncbi:scavenger receptor cysteine-rich type 1 protein M130-like, partial [Trematomus bernacchii]|uniref:scavenger receptor cysteine-rich type 1 protein M130-like n=1 Tax=Trematomus bernacchii TaxID=40690 RepID=UPI00146DDC66
MDHLLLLMMLLLCSSGLQAEGEHNSTEPGVRLVGGESRCAGDLEVRIRVQGEWRPVDYSSPWTLQDVGVACRELDCGSAVSVGERKESSKRSALYITSYCSQPVQSVSALRECFASSSSSSFLNLTCS